MWAENNKKECIAIVDNILERTPLGAKLFVNQLLSLERVSRTVPREVGRLDKRLIRSLLKAIRAVQSLFAMICSNYTLFRAFQKI